MPKLYYSLCLLLTAHTLFGQSATALPTDDVTAETPSESSGTQIRPQLSEQSWFVERPGSMLIYLPEAVIVDWDRVERRSDLRFLDIEMDTPPKARGDETVAIVHFVPLKSGILTLPSLYFTGDTDTYKSTAIQIQVSELQASRQMSLQLLPERKTVYTNQALRIDLIWDCDLTADTLSELKLNPTFFNNPEIQTIVPRTTAPEKKQVGLPIGGRRVIATRTTDDAKRALGRIELPIYLSFEAPGTYTLPAVQLEIAHLEKEQTFGRYAAHFNNSLFDPVPADAAHQRIFTRSAPITIEVLPVPKPSMPSPTPTLFDPLSITVQVQAQEITVGQLLEISLEVHAEAPHGMIELPPLSTQPALRSHFLVEDDYRASWQNTGTLFQTRIRPLSTEIKSFPSLKFEVWDAQTASYRILTTEAVPLTVRPNNGQQTINPSSFQTDPDPLAPNPEGIWSNRQITPMTAFTQTLLHALSAGFWPILIGLSICAAIGIPVARKRRRRALDPHYNACLNSYQNFKRQPANSSAQWQAFIDFMAQCTGAQGRAWTLKDSQRCLQALPLSEETRTTILQKHQLEDNARYQDKQAPVQPCDNLHPVMKKVTRALRRHSALLIGLVFISLSFCPKVALADTWQDAETAFARGENAVSGSDAANAAYSEAALLFEHAARENAPPAPAWINAGNAWFRVGQLGRSIAAYREATAYAPFDSELANNLNNARALVRTNVGLSSTHWTEVPRSWLRAATLTLAAIWVGLIIAYIRYRRGHLTLALSIATTLLLLSSAWLIQREMASGKSAVLIAESTQARKGPDFAYANAFTEPLSDGVEGIIRESRNEWVKLELPNGQAGWLPKEQVQTIAY